MRCQIWKTGWLSRLIVVAALAISLGGCKKDEPSMEDMAKDAEKQVEDAKDSDMAEEAEEAAEDAAKDAEKAAEGLMK